MANKDQPMGFRPHGEVKEIAVMEAGSACYPGDMVRLAADGQVDPASAGATLLGLCLDYASGAGVKVRVSISPDQLYVGQADETQLDAQTDIGQLCDIVATGGNSTYKVSRQEVDSSTVGDGAGGQLVIMGLLNKVDNAFGAQAEVIVKINEHQLVTGFAGI